MSKRDTKNPFNLPPDRRAAAEASAQAAIDQIEDALLDRPRHERPILLMGVMQQIDAHLRAMLERPGLSGADKEVLEMRLREGERNLAEWKREFDGL